MAVLAATLLLAAPALASYEQVKEFGTSGEGKLSEIATTAVNTTGNGGVSVGTVYVTNNENAASSVDILVFNSKGEYLSKFGNFHSGGFALPPMGIAVDQATGDVYVLLARREGETGVVQVFDAEGHPIAGFGEAAPFLETVAAGPAKIHNPKLSGIAVDSSGDVYLADEGPPRHVQEGRVMVFKPETPGDYEHYLYAGQPHDIAAGDFPGPLAFDDSSGHLYVNGANEHIYTFAPAQPTAPACAFLTPGGPLFGLAVDSASGEAFTFRDSKHKFLRLDPCAEPANQLKEAFPGPATLTRSLAFNPSLSYEAGRPPGTLYAVSENEGSSVLPAGHIFAQAAEHPPTVDAESVASVGTSSATLRAQVNPQGFETRYAFSYLTEAQFEENLANSLPGFQGAAEAPLGGGALGTGKADLPAAATLTGLDPGTTYRYRVLATSNCKPSEPTEVCTTPGPDQAFHTYPLTAPGLPDHRAYELVSPAQKNGGEVLPASPGIASCGNECKPGLNLEPFPMQSAPGGDSVVYEGTPFLASGGAVNENSYLSTRTAAGWQTADLSPTLASKGSGQGYKAFSADLSRGLLYQIEPSLSPQAPTLAGKGYADLYSQPSAQPASLTPLLTEAQGPLLHRVTGGGANNLKLAFAGANSGAAEAPAFSHLLFTANDALTPEVPGIAPAALDGGESKDNLYESVGGQLRLVNVAPGNAATAPGAAFGSGAALATITQTPDYSHAISADGSRVFWSDEAGQLFVRVNGEETREVHDLGRFLTASADGSKVLLNDGCLYDLQEEQCEDLTLDQSDVHQGGFAGILGASADLSSVYFVDTAVLAGNENANHETAHPGAFNLYRWHAGATSFVAALSPSDGATGIGGVQSLAVADFAASPSDRTAQVTSDGRWLAFMSVARLTGYENSGPCGKNNHGEIVNAPCLEVFLYDSQTGHLACASCNPTLARPLGFSHLTLINPGEGTPPLPQPLNLASDGRLFFDSSDALSPSDANGRVEDVYEYAPKGTGSCESEATEGGCLSLISSGHGAYDANFLAADPAGRNVFFTTRNQLLPADTDDLIDLYDARENGGIAEPEATPPCNGEACKPPPAGSPSEPNPASSTFAGPGNSEEAVTKPPCPKGKVRKHGRCVKAHKKHKRHHTRSHKRTANANRGGAK